MKALQSRILPSEHSVLLPPQGLLLPGALMTSFLLLRRLHYLQDCPFFILGPVACHSPYCLRSLDTTVLTPWNLPHSLTASRLPLSHLTCESPYTSSVSLSWENSASVCHLAWWGIKGHWLTIAYVSGLPSSIPSEKRRRRAGLGLGLVWSGGSEPTWNPRFPVHPLSLLTTGSQIRIITLLLLIQVPIP